MKYNPQQESSTHTSINWVLAKILLCLSLQGVASKNTRPFIRLPSTQASSPSPNKAAPWHSDSYLSKKDWDNLRRYQRMPPTIFAPEGRLHSVERIMEALSSEEDPTSNLVIALQCRDGVVVVSNVNTPPNAVMLLLKEDNPPNATDTNTINTINEGRTNHTAISSRKKSRPLWLEYPAAKASDSTIAPWSYSSSCVARIPFQENDNLFAITAGNAVHSQILRHLIRKVAESIYVANDDGIYKAQPNAQQHASPSALVLARRLADHFQKPTQSEGPKVPRMLVSCALIVGVNEGIWQIDPTGQFWQCQVAVVGRGADKARSFVLQKVAASAESSSGTSEGESERETTHAQLQDFLSKLSVPEAIKLAGECIQHTVGKGLQPAFVGTTSKSRSNDETDTPGYATTQLEQPLLAFSVQRSAEGQQEVRWYQPKDFESCVSLE